jgi:hypothetical protein
MLTVDPQGLTDAAGQVETSAGVLADQVERCAPQRGAVVKLLRAHLARSR